jgi:hypothetical protein
MLELEPGSQSPTLPFYFTIIAYLPPQIKNHVSVFYNLCSKI